MLRTSYGFGLGLELLRQGELRHALPYLVRPINYWRTAEYAAVSRALDFKAGDLVLDVGSPKLLSIYLADQVAAEVHATDIEPYFLEKLSVVRSLKHIPPRRLQLEVEDGRRLSFPDATFDKAYSISVLEHIPDHGDSDCIREIARVLKPGGRCVITVPFAPEERDELRKGGFYWEGSSKREGDRVFYQRRYSEATLHERLIDPSGLEVEQIGYIGDKLPLGGRREVSDYLPAITGLLQPWLSHLLHTPVEASWREMTKPLCAVLVLRK